ncbi:glycoside hydrolase family 3 N-terminal domain-containing protein [Neobacillus drentensis]|uniref:beta-N-acetylhexosaminidase n=1 Tax=Neobacillus rhizosphaerae TaxID=2880965 RepID=A0ABM9ELY7_9BACI|nr:glycoside hydrolase family 3 N-terminal domain-containing protein [Neobacillus rhizosphaerae]CAH2713140.1 Beta-N-acetylglucosaminidase/beta-glucosidase [Neobacillus rhizosphaerae]
MINLKGKPFCLNDEDIQWVEDTLAGMSDEEKLGQLFCLIAYSDDEEYLKKIPVKYNPGGLMCRPMPAKQVFNTVRILQENSKIPMLISANLEKGANGIVEEGTFIGSQMQVAATDDDEMAYKLGVVCGREGSAVGANWAFAPIIDIDYNFRNPITNTRTFGSDPDRVRRMGAQYVKGVQEYGVAASIKHFPGDGMDERDQHLVTSINSMSCEDWDKTYGANYRACIEAGAMTVMVGHIMQPAYTKKFNPQIKDEDILPATLSYELVTKLLKEQLGFNGLVVTDASTMAGMQIPMHREKAVPQAIAAGCDMFLFTENIDEDYEYMRKGIKNGIVTQERLNDAITKILALKAALKLPKKQKEGKLVPTPDEALKNIGTEEHKAWAAECADKAITIVKEETGVLPLSPKKYKKVLYYDIESQQGFAYSVRTGVAEKVKNLLEKEGFDIDVFKPNPDYEGLADRYGEITEKYDLIIYLANMATKSNQTTVRIEWAQPMGANVPVFTNAIPTVFISVENPYHLLDVPRIKTYINTYSSNDFVLEALIDKLMGRSEFQGISPVDPFCGMWDTRL